MPLVYEFKCPDCGRVVESRCSDGLFCDNYHEPVEMRKVFSLGGIAFKGRGFYKNDSKKGD